MCGTMNALLYRWLRYALNLYPSVLSGYINILPLAIHCLALPTKLHGLPTSLFVHGGRQDEANHRVRQACAQ